MKKKRVRVQLRNLPEDEHVPETIDTPHQADMLACSSTIHELIRDTDGQDPFWQRYQFAHRQSQPGNSLKSRWRNSARLRKVKVSLPKLKWMDK